MKKLKKLKKIKNKKKLIIIGTFIIGVLISAIVIPIVVVNSIKEKEDKEDVESVFKILKLKSSSKKTLVIDNNSTGKIIANNKEKIITKIKELIGISNLKGVSIDVTIKNDVDISEKIAKSIIVTIKKGKYSKKFEGKNSLKVKKDDKNRKEKINIIKRYLKNESEKKKNNQPNELEFILTDELPSEYKKLNSDEEKKIDNKILAAIRKKIADDINKIENIEINNINKLITKKIGEDYLTVVPIKENEDGPSWNSYYITVDNEDCHLELIQLR